MTDIHSRSEALNLRVVTYTNVATPACEDPDGRRFWIPRDAVARDGSAGIFRRVASDGNYDFDGWEPWCDVPHCGTLHGGRYHTYEAALAWMEARR